MIICVLYRENSLTFSVFFCAYNLIYFNFINLIFV